MKDGGIDFTYYGTPLADAWRKQGYPFYFGRSGENVFALMFERTSDKGELRFAQSPSGGGKGNPAWDFVYFRRDYAVNREFSFRVRAVFRKFTSADEIVRLYEHWSRQKVKFLQL